MRTFSRKKFRAVAYYRHSREKAQEQSIPIQREKTQGLADDHDVEIIHEIEDDKTGLNADRPGFQALFRDWIMNPDAPPFDYVFVNDVTRFGRFQNIDESAHYSFLAEQYGKKIIYVENGFPKDDQPILYAMQTTIQRFEAAQFSRRQSIKVKDGAVKVVKSGFSAGGIAPYGLSRQLLAIDHQTPKQILRHGEHKSISNERVRLISSEDETTEIVRNIFKLYVRYWKSTSEIAEWLNNKKTNSPGTGDWNSEKVRRILSNPIYKGTLIYNKKSNFLKTGTVKNARENWVIKENALTPIISSGVFALAGERLFWSSPKNFQRGRSRIRLAKKLLHKDISEIFKSNDKKFIDQKIKDFSYSITLNSGGPDPCWCFCVENCELRLEKVLCIGVHPNSKNVVDTFFIIPGDFFRFGNHFLFSYKEALERGFVIDVDRIEHELALL